MTRRKAATKPVRLGANQPARFYRGGVQIARFRGAAVSSARAPEDWVASTSSLYGEPDRGQTRLGDGRSLADHIRSSPDSWLGAEHFAEWGADPALLVKLLDASERLPVHVHPDRAFSKRWLGLTHGKTEGWVMLRSANAHLGFRRAVGLDELLDLVRRQDVESILSLMTEVWLAVGDAVLVPAGLPHALGAGAFLVEVQEPTDLSILLEWRDFTVDGVADGHLGLGFETALTAVDRTAWSIERVAGLIGTRSGSFGAMFPPSADAFFRAELHRVVGRDVLDRGYSVLVVTSGQGTVTSEAGAAMRIAAGDTVLVPFAAGACAINGDLELVRCRPPAPGQRTPV
jgi:mannose-6-phosphate isomerase